MRSGKGWVKQCDGQYKYALVRTRGACCPDDRRDDRRSGPPLTPSLRPPHRPHPRGKGAVDRTQYGSTRISPKSYFVHHTQRITKAAVMHDAKAIRLLT